MHVRSNVVWDGVGEKRWAEVWMLLQSQIPMCFINHSFEMQEVADPLCLLHPGTLRQGRSPCNPSIAKLSNHCKKK